MERNECLPLLVTQVGFSTWLIFQRCRRLLLIDLFTLPSYKVQSSKKTFNLDNQLVMRDGAANAVIFSNSTDAITSATLSNCLHSYAHLFQQIVMVEEARRYMPALEVYDLLTRKMGKGQEGMGDIWLTSENPVDIVRAHAVGMRAVWVDRGGSEFGWADRLVDGKGGRPTAEVRGREEIADVVKRHART